MSILVIGSLNMDISIKTDRMPKLGETITGTGFSTQPGGKGGNQAIAVARLGGDTKFLGAVGNDIYGSTLSENLEKNNVAYCGAVCDGVPTGTAVITVCNGDNCIILNPGANGQVTPKLISDNEKLFIEADYVVMQLEIPMETVLAAAKMAKTHNCKVVLNPAPYIDLPSELLRLTDIIIPNEHEAALLTGIEITDNETAIKAINAIKELGIGIAVITLGSKGSAYNIGDEVYFCDAKKAKAVDTTAAGDTFIGGFITMLSQGKDIHYAVKLGTAAAGITVTRPGAADSIPTLDEVIM